FFFQAEDGIRDRTVTGVQTCALPILYYDAQTDDSRLVLATARSAARAGALVANYIEMSSLLKPDGRVRGAVARDVLMRGESFTIDRKSTRLNSSHRTISYAVFCLKKK